MAITNKIKAIANAIRTKTNKSEMLTLDEMPSEILNIETSSIQPLDGKPKVIYAYSQNWNYTTANWQRYSAETYTASWGILGSRVPIEKDDFVFFYGTDTTKNKPITLITRATGNGNNTGVRSVGLLEGKATGEQVKAFLDTKELEYSANTQMIVDFY